MIFIESKDNNLYKETKKLKERKGRNKSSKYIIEGFRLVQEAFKAKEDIEGNPPLSPVKMMIDECKGTKNAKAIMLLDKLLNSEIIYELFDR